MPLVIKNMTSGEVQEVVDPIVVSTFCKNNDHNYIVSSMEKREAKCVKCGKGTTIIVGTDTIDKNGRVKFNR